MSPWEQHGTTVNMFWGPENWIAGISRAGFTLGSPLEIGGLVELGKSGSARNPRLGDLFFSSRSRCTAVSGGNSSWNNSFVPVDQLFQDGSTLQQSDMAIGHQKRGWFVSRWIFPPRQNSPERPLLVWSLLCWWRSHGFSNFNCHRVSPLDCWGLFPIIWWFWHQHNYIKQYNWITLHCLTTILLPGFIRSHICGPLSVFSHI